MAKKAAKVDSFSILNDSIKNNNVSRFYIFHGPERYLLERSIANLRSYICPDGTQSFNYRRLEGGKTLEIDMIEDAVNTFPMFADRTLVEIHDFDIFAKSTIEQIREVLADLPEYVCLVFSYDTIPYKVDGRLKINKEILSFANVLEFAVQDSTKLVKWITRHFHDAGKKINFDDANYLAFISGGLMNVLYSEIGKVAAYSKTETISRGDIDAVVTPTLDTVSYKLTDAIIFREHKQAIKLLDELFQMREAPHKLIYSISLAMRQLLAARVCLDNNLTKNDLMEICDVKFDFIAVKLLNTAKKSSLEDVKKKVLACSDTAFELNRTSDSESRLIELVTKLALG